MPFHFLYIIVISLSLKSDSHPYALLNELKNIIKQLETLQQRYSETEITKATNIIRKKGGKTSPFLSTITLEQCAQDWRDYIAIENNLIKTWQTAWQKKSTFILKGLLAKYFHAKIPDLNNYSYQNIKLGSTNIKLKKIKNKIQPVNKKHFITWIENHLKFFKHIQQTKITTNTYIIKKYFRDITYNYSTISLDVSIDIKGITIYERKQHEQIEAQVQLKRTQGFWQIAYLKINSWKSLSTLQNKTLQGKGVTNNFIDLRPTLLYKKYFELYKKTDKNKQTSKLNIRLPTPKFTTFLTSCINNWKLSPSKELEFFNTSETIIIFSKDNKNKWIKTSTPRLRWTQNYLYLLSISDYNNDGLIDFYFKGNNLQTKHQLLLNYFPVLVGLQKLDYKYLSNNLINIFTDENNKSSQLQKTKEALFINLDKGDFIDVSFFIQ
jgi:hypothetical protein